MLQKQVKRIERVKTEMKELTIRYGMQALNQFFFPLAFAVLMRMSIINLAQSNLRIASMLITAG